MPKYRYTGAIPWRRDSGEVVPPRSIFEATAREHERFQRRRSELFVLVHEEAPVEDKALVVEEPTPTPEPETVAEENAEEVIEEAELDEALLDEDRLPEWPLKMAPSRYLELHPDGPNADLARTLLTNGG